MATLSKADEEARLAKRKADLAKGHKSKFGNPSTKVLEAKLEDLTPPVPPSGDQNDVPASTSGDQNDVKQADSAKVKKPKRKPSATVVAWRAAEKPPVEAVITVKPEFLAKCPKRRDAERRFKLYQTGQTVAQYITTAKENGISGALAMQDVMWDRVKGFITLEMPK